MLTSVLVVLTLLADVITVDDDGPAEFSSIQAAIHAAASGDTIVVEPGTYAGFSLGKDLSILGREGAGPVRTTGVVIVHLAPAFRLAGLEVPTLVVRDVPGVGVVDDCTVGVWMKSLEQPSLRISNCAQVLVGRCNVRGKVGDSYASTGFGTSGWIGATVENSRVEFVGCTIGGGGGGVFSGNPTDGAAGLVVRLGSHVELSGCPDIFGGFEGDKLCLCQSTGATGDGIQVGDSTVLIRGASTDWVAQGYYSWFPEPEGFSIHAQLGGNVIVSGVSLGQFGVKLDFGGAVTILPEAEPFLELTGEVQPGLFSILNVTGPAGEPAWILVSPAAALTPVNALDGLLWPAPPWWLVSLATTGATLGNATQLPAGAGLEGTTWYVQAVFPGVPGTLNPTKMFVSTPDVLLIRN